LPDGSALEHQRRDLTSWLLGERERPDLTPQTPRLDLTLARSRAGRLRGRAEPKERQPPALLDAVADRECRPRHHAEHVEVGLLRDRAEAAKGHLQPGAPPLPDVLDRLHAALVDLEAEVAHKRAARA
jgi:hypothetical protein